MAVSSLVEETGVPLIYRRTSVPVNPGQTLSSILNGQQHTLRFDVGCDQSDLDIYFSYIQNIHFYSCTQ